MSANARLHLAAEVVEDRLGLENIVPVHQMIQADERAIILIYAAVYEKLTEKGLIGKKISGKVVFSPPFMLTHNVETGMESTLSKNI